MSVVVFLGPTVPIEEARARLNAIFLPPCGMGDVYAAVERYRPRVIGIIDGFFERTPAVWHKEILYAIDRGVTVFGASSMGALRAAELAPFGMRGIGRIFESYASGGLEDDDEVAVSHLPAEDGYRMLSDAMVNMRFGLEAARGAGIISAIEEAALVAEAKAFYYPQRSWAALWTGAAAAELPAGRLERLRAFIEAERPDLKRADGLQLLDTLRRVAAAPTEPRNSSFRFEPTIFWEHLRACRGSTPAAGNGEVRHEQLVDHVRLADPQRAALVDEALLLHLCEAEAARLGVAAGDDRSALTRFRMERGLESAAALRAWMEAQRTGPDECLKLARAEALLRTLRWRFSEQINALLPAVLKRRGRYGAALAEVAGKWRRLGSANMPAPSDADVGSMDEVLAWYQARHGKIHTTIEEHLSEVGFGSPRQFTNELVATYLAAAPEPQEVSHAA